MVNERVPRPSQCQACHIELPTAATQPWCDDHEGGHTPPAPDKPAPGRPVRVVHNGAISKLNGGLDNMESGARN